MGMSLIDRFLEDHRLFRLHIAKVRASAASLPSGTVPPGITQEDRDFATRLRRHARMESELLFPAMQRAGSEQALQKTVGHFIAHGQDEHASVAKRHAEFHATEGTRLEKWRASLDHFAEGLTRHMELEEREIFPFAQKLLSQSILDDLDKKANKIP